MPVNKRFFDDIMSDRRISLRSVAREMEISPSQLSRTLTGHRRMQLTEAVRLGQILGVPLAEVMINAGIEEAKTAGRRCSIVGHILEDGFVHLTEEGAIERITLPDGVPDEDVFAIQFRTSDTALSFADGWVMFFESPRDPVDSLGVFALCKLEDGSQIVATIRRGYAMGTYNLFSYNSLHIKSARVVSAARAILTIH